MTLCGYSNVMAGDECNVAVAVIMCGVKSVVVMWTCGMSNIAVVTCDCCSCTEV